MVIDQAHRYAREHVRLAETRETILGVIEKATIEEALVFWKGNKCHASRALGMHRNTLARQIRKYGIIAPPLRMK